MDPSVLSRYATATLQEINLYPYLTWVFYGILLATCPFWLRTKKRLYTLFLATLILETAFVIDLGFFIRPSYIIGAILVLRVAARGIRFRLWYGLVFGLFAAAAVVGVFMNLDLIGAAKSGESRATFLRPLIQIGQLTMMAFIMIATYTVLREHGYFRHTMRMLHWLSVAVAVSAFYELAAIYFHLPYVNLNNMLPAYWYPGFGSAIGYIFRARVTFIEPIELNNFQLLGIACSLIYRFLYDVPWRRYWPLLTVQLLVLLGTFSRSTLLVVLVLTPFFMFCYPRSVRSAFGFFMNHTLRVGLVAIGIAFIVFTVTVKPDTIERQNVIVQALYTRLVLHQAAADKLTLLGRGDAQLDIQRITHQGRSLAFGAGIGNDANIMGGVGGTASIYNQVITYSGMFGLSLFLVFVGSMLWELFRNRWRRIGVQRDRQVYWIFFVGLLGMLAHRLAFSGLLTDTYLWVAFAIGIHLGNGSEVFGGNETARLLPSSSPTRVGEAGGNRRSIATSPAQAI